MSVRDGAPYTHEEWVAVTAAVREERDRRRRVRMVNPDGIVLFSQSEQSEFVAEFIKRRREDRLESAGK